MSAPVDVVLALDPGGTTGLAYGHIVDNKLTIAPTQRAMLLNEVYELMQMFCESSPRKWNIVWESFEYRNRGRPGLDQTPIKIIAILELFRDRHDMVDANFYSQTASQGKAFYTDEKLKRLGLWPKGMPHGRDAIRHLLQWCTFGAGGQLIKMKDAEIEMVDLADFPTIK